MRQFHAGGVHPTAAHKHHAHTAFGPCNHVSDQLLSHMPFIVHTEVDAHGRHEQPVLGF